MVNRSTFSLAGRWFLTGFAVLTACASPPGDESRLASALQPMLDSLVAETGAPGATMGVAWSDGSAIGLATGLADTASAQAMPTDGRMLAASVGKTFFSAALLGLVGEGRLSLDDPVAEWLGDEPWFDRLPNAESMTVRQIMNHTSGLTRYELHPGFLEELRADPDRTFTIEERVRHLYGMEPPFAPGEGWTYADTNYILVARIIERVTGRDANEVIHERLLGPMGLGGIVPSNDPSVPGIVQAYAGPENPFGEFDAMVEDGRLLINPQFEWGGGGYATTAPDLAEWMLRLQGGEAFADEVMDEYQTGPEAPLGPGARYGLGVIMLDFESVGPAYGHSGFMPGYRTEVYYFRELGAAIALQVNTSDRLALQLSPLRMLERLASRLAEIQASESD